MLPFAGVLTFLLGQAIPYYRFMNATAAPMALAGLGAFLAVRWLLRGDGGRRIAGVLGAIVVIGALAWVFLDPAINQWATPDNQWAPQSVRTSLAAVREVVDGGRRTPEHPDRELERTPTTRPGRTRPTGGRRRSRTCSGRAPRRPREVQRDVRRHGRELPPRGPHRRPERGLRTRRGATGTRSSCARLAYPAPPVVFLIGEYYQGLCNGVSAGECTPQVEEEAFRPRSRTRSRSDPGRTCSPATGSTSRRRSWTARARRPTRPPRASPTRPARSRTSRTRRGSSPGCSSWRSCRGCSPRRSSA